MKKGLFIVLIFALLITFSNWAEGQQEGAKSAGKTISLYIGSWWKDAMPGIIEKFEDTHPNVNVNLELVPWTGYLDKAALSSMGADAPEILALSDVFLHTLASRDLLGPLDAYVGKGVNPDDYFESMWKGGQFKGVQYGVPYRMSARALYYNKQHLSEAGLDSSRTPNDLDELLEYAKKLTKPGRYGLGVPMALSSPTEAMRELYEFMDTMGGRVLDEDYENCLINEKVSVDAVQWYTDLITKHKVVSRDSIGLIEDEQGYRFGAGKVSMMVGGFALRNYIARTAREDLDWSAGAAPKKVVTWGWHMTIPANAKEKDAAAQFIGWFTKPDNLLQNTIRPPTVKKAVDDKVWGYGGEQELGPFLESALNGIMVPPIKEWSEISHMVTESLHQIIIAGTDVQEAMNMLKISIDALLNQ